jgi:signal transduction histidine kinase
MRALRVAACTVAIAVAALVAVGMLGFAGVAPSARTDDTSAWFAPFVALASLAPAAVGLAIALRRPRNLVAWILLAGGLTTAPLTDLGIGAGWSLQTDRALWPLHYAWPIAIAYVFPDGRLLSRRWRWLAGAVLASFAGFMALALLDPTPFGAPNAAVPNPLAGSRLGQTVVDTPALWVPFLLGILGGLVAGALAVRLRLRRATGIARLQMLWLAWVATLAPLGLLLCMASWVVLDIGPVLVYPFLLLVEVAAALAVGVAVARYRLYAIESLLNRTLVYATLTLLLAVTYGAVAVGAGVAAGRGSAWAAAAATLAAALAFRPLRAAVQSGVDRRFSRERYDAVRRVQAFEHDVREGRRAPEEIGQVLAGALGDPRAELLFRLADGDDCVDAAGRVVPAREVDGRARAEIVHGGAPVAVLLHDPSLRERPALLEGVLSAATLSIEIARLRVEVRLRLAEVEASRARIVEAGHEERRRLERDLHDGAQQRLVSLGLRIRRMERSLPAEAAILAPALDQIVDEITGAIADLRRIAAGIRPAALQDGLDAALRGLARTAPIPVEVEASARRAPAGIEAVAYFVACEALTNVVKHASASKAAVRALHENGSLVVSVADDGVGGAALRRGSGLTGLQDRIAAHGGTFRIASPAGGGTHVEVVLPCES